VAHFQKNFFVACEVLIGEVARRGIDAKLTESPPPTSPWAPPAAAPVTFRAILQCFPPKRGPGSV